MKKLLIILVTGAVLISSCKKDFLVQDPYEQLPSDVAIIDESSMQTAVYGMYAQLRNANLYGRSLPLYADVMADNAFISTTNSNRYIAEYNFTFTSANANSSGTWASAYIAILRANNIINSTIPVTTVSSQLRGEALTVRALMYFNLINWFAKQYTVDPNADGVPLITVYDAYLKPARKKVSEVYAQIDKDLVDAFGLLTSVTKNSSYVTKYVARALQARVALFKGDWANAKVYAQDVITNGKYFLSPAATYADYWKTAAPVAVASAASPKLETIFENTSDAIANNGTNALSYFYDQAGYGDALCADDLYNKFTATDVRRGLFLTGTRGGLTVRIVNKYSNTNNPADKDDTKILRYSEILLTMAEANYRLNDEPGARQYLNMVAQQRDPSLPAIASTGAALFEDIILERRKELAFEGMRYLDLQRLNRDVTRVNINNNYQGVTPITIAVGNFRRIFPIPQDERDANPNIGQNTGY
jgi:hypothetical protein